jgi:hypothetical protein
VFLHQWGYTIGAFFGNRFATPTIQHIERFGDAVSFSELISVLPAPKGSQSADPSLEIQQFALEKRDRHVRQGPAWVWHDISEE